MSTLRRLRDSWRRHQRRQKLRRELADFRTPAERAELEALLARYDTTIGELIRNVDAEPIEPIEPIDSLDSVPELALGTLPIPRQRHG